MKITSIIIFTVLSFNLHGQTSDDTTDIELFNLGLEHYNNGNLDSTLILWTKIVDNKIGVGNDTYGNAFFNIPTVYWQLKNYEKAKEWYKKILASELRDNDETGSLMEPHTNYKHKSAIALAGLYQIDSNYMEVLEWLNKADTLYRYWGFEGSKTNVSKKQAYLLEWKTEILRKLDRQNEAVRAILTELIYSDKLEGYFSTSEDTLFKLIDKKSFKLEFDMAISQMEIIMINDSNWIASFSLNGLAYKIPISNVYPDRNLPHYWTIYFIGKKSVPDKKNFINYVKERNFYLRMTN